jgi:hypothetical protein
VRAPNKFVSVPDFETSKKETLEINKQSQRHTAWRQLQKGSTVHYSGVHAFDRTRARIERRRLVACATLFWRRQFGSRLGTRKLVQLCQRRGGTQKLDYT